MISQTELGNPVHNLQKPVTPHHRHSSSDVTPKRPPKMLLESFNGGDNIKAPVFSPMLRGKSRRYTDNHEAKQDSPSSPQQRTSYPKHHEFRIKSALGSLRTSSQDVMATSEKQEEANSNVNSLFTLKSQTVCSIDTQDTATPSKTSLNGSVTAMNRERVMSDSVVKLGPGRTASDETGSNLNRQRSSKFKTISHMEDHVNLRLSPCNSSPKKVKTISEKPTKSTGIVKAFGANTNNGIVRTYNEDKVSIILNIIKPATLDSEQWPKCSFFGVYDGHGGAACADFLRDNLYRYVVKEPSFPSNPREALRKGFQAAEAKFLEISQTLTDTKIERSGSCALVALIVGDICYIANVGDSRAVLSGGNGKKVFTLTKDHKPSEESEQKRIIAAGGKVYQTPMELANPSFNAPPARVFPGRLSVSRTFGDAHAKLAKYGGNPDVIIAEPEIKAFKIQPHYDFIVLATDGIYDQLSSREVIETVWKGINGEDCTLNAHEKCAIGVESLLKEAMERRSLDNVTAVLISFTDFVVTNDKEIVFHDISKEDSQIPTVESPGLKKGSTLKFNVVSPNEVLAGEKSTANDREEYFKPSSPSNFAKYKQLQMDFSPKKMLTGFYTKPTEFSVKSKEHKRNGSLGF